jgi:hypothetical protein
MLLFLCFLLLLKLSLLLLLLLLVLFLWCLTSDRCSHHQVPNKEAANDIVQDSDKDEEDDEVGSHKKTGGSDDAADVAAPSAAVISSQASAASVAAPSAAVTSSQASAVAASPDVHIPGKKVNKTPEEIRTLAPTGKGTCFTELLATRTVTGRINGRSMSRRWGGCTSRTQEDARTEVLAWMWSEAG